MPNVTTLETDKVVLVIHVRLLIDRHRSVPSLLLLGVSVEGPKASVSHSFTMELGWTYLLDMNLAGWKGSKRFVNDVACVLRITLTFSGWKMADSGIRG